MQGLLWYFNNNNFPYLRNSFKTFSPMSYSSPTWLCSFFKRKSAFGNRFLAAVEKRFPPAVPRPSAEVQEYTLPLPWNKHCTKGEKNVFGMSE